MIEHISVLIVAGPESSSYATFGGGNKALDTRSSWNHGVGTRLDDFSIDVDPLFIE